MSQDDYVDFLATMMVVDHDVARRVLEKHNGDMDKASNALLSGDRGEDYSNTLPLSEIAATSQPQTTTTPSIEVDTDDDRELTRAIQMSMETSQPEPEPTFGPSERPPDPNWQMVPVSSRQPPAADGVSSEDQSLEAAIQASYQEMAVDDDDLSSHNPMRQEKTPVALRTPQSNIAYAAVVRAIFERTARVEVVSGHSCVVFRSTSATSTRKLDYHIRKWAIFIILVLAFLISLEGDPLSRLVELFTCMDLGKFAYFEDRIAIPLLGPQPIQGPTNPLYNLTTELLHTLSSMLDARLSDTSSGTPPQRKLMSFSYANFRVQNGHILNMGEIGESPHVFADFRKDTPSTLVSLLSETLVRPIAENAAQYTAITRLSDVLFFTINRSGNDASSMPDLFYPKFLYLDQFMESSLLRAHDLYIDQRNKLKEAGILEEKNHSLTHFKDKDTLADLRASINYFENVANDNGNSERHAGLQQTAEILKNILESIEANVEENNQKAQVMRSDASRAFDCPEFQNYRYDLRAVCIHTGLPGRKQIYSYVLDDDGVWWKTVDVVVTQVSEETVFTDTTGKHLGAGPFLLVYNASMSPEEANQPIQWPQGFVEQIQNDNRQLCANMESRLPSMLTTSNNESRGTQSVYHTPRSDSPALA
ncbi:hypothetical protein FISHEDRAFT_72685 [Fistulina hepatica ATCC 64428]|nr:hypothetical protein FISHEDRAFT_72685 [Fistulina hepatica ATCC 64428]